MDAIILKSFIPEIFLSLSILLQLIFNIRTINSSKFNFPILDKEIFIQVLFIIFSVFFLLYNLKIEGFFSNFLFFNNEGSRIVKIIFIIINFLALFIIFKAFSVQKLNFFEFFIILLFSILSSFFLISSYDLLSAYLSIEMQALCFYILASFKRNSAFSTEAGLKYFISGAFISCIFLLGASILYGSLGTLNLNYINLSFNNISYFSIIIFTTMPQLKTIDLSFNNIKRIASFFKTRVIMPSVELIKVDGNKFHCNEIVNMLFYGASLAPKLQWLPKISYVETCSKDMYTAICNKTKLLCCRNDNAINYDFNKDFNETNMKKTTIPPSTSNNNNKNTYVVIISLLGLISCISSCIICREYHKVIIEKNKSLLLFVILF